METDIISGSTSTKVNNFANKSNKVNLPRMTSLFSSVFGYLPLLLWEVLQFLSDPFHPYHIRKIPANISFVIALSPVLSRDLLLPFFLTKERKIHGNKLQVLFCQFPVDVLEYISTKLALNSCVLVALKPILLSDGARDNEIVRFRERGRWIGDIFVESGGGVQSQNSFGWVALLILDFITKILTNLMIVTINTNSVIL